MLKLFTTGTTRALPPLMLLEEAEANYELVVVDIRQKERPAELLEFNSQGRMPALIDGDLRIDQSLAILIYLAERFDLFLPGKEPARSEALRLLMVAATDIMFEHSTVFRLVRRNESGQNDSLIHDTRQRLMGDIAKCDNILKSRSYLAGEISIADLMLYAIVGQYDRPTVDRLGFAALGSWIDRVRARPAVRHAEIKCPYLYDVSATLGSDHYQPEAASEGLRPVS